MVSARTGGQTPTRAFRGVGGRGVPGVSCAPAPTPAPRHAPAWWCGSASSAPAPRPARRPPGGAAPPARHPSRGRRGVRLVVQLRQLGADPEAGQVPASGRSSTSSAPAPRPAKRPPGGAAPPARRPPRGRRGARLVVQLHRLGARPEAGEASAWWRSSARSAPVPRPARRPPGGAAPPARRRSRGRPGARPVALRCPPA
jgi:hypothetical protein